MIRTLALWLLIGAAICLIPVIAGYLYSGRRVPLEGNSLRGGRDIYEQTCDALGYRADLGYDTEGTP